MTTTAVILAAGFSTRMGVENKLLLEVAGRPLVRSVAEAVAAVCDLPPVVVLGHEADRVADCLAGLDVRFAVNPDPSAGQASSVETGLREVADADDTIVALGDQPFLTAAALAALIAAHRSAAPGLITVPVSGDRRGNPIVLPRARRSDVLAGGPNLGCRHLTRSNPHLVHRFETDDPAYFLDVDTPEDLARARAGTAAQPVS